MKRFCHFRVLKLNRSVKMEIINVPLASFTQRGQLIDVGRAFRKNRLLFIFANSFGKNENF